MAVEKVILSQKSYLMKQLTVNQKLAGCFLSNLTLGPVLNSHKLCYEMSMSLCKEMLI